ncbi:MAG: TIGR02302 family protein [Pseudomonadota bacterium]
MAEDTRLPRSLAYRLRWPIALTWVGLLAERAMRAFWPLASVVMVVLATLMLGIQDSVPMELAWGMAMAALAGTGWTLFRGVRHFKFPARADAVARLDATLPGRPIAAVKDVQAIGSGDAASERLWDAHVARMADRAKGAKAAQPNLRLASRDPFALRYVALLVFVAALLFGSIWRVSSVSDLAPSGAGASLAAGPAWEGWIEPPLHTSRPSLYLNDIDRESLSVPQGSEITLRLYGEIGALSVSETVSGRAGELPPASDPQQSFVITQDGQLSVDGPGGQAWEITVIPDTAPEVSVTAPLERTAGGEFRQPFRATDDYGVIAGRAELTLDLERVSRRYGLSTDPEPRETIVLDLPLTISGDRADFEETLIDDLAEHPWAGLPVALELFAEDAAGQIGSSGAQAVTLPARRFFDPLAQSIIEQRRDLLWSRANAPRISAVLRAISHRPEGHFRSETAYLKLRVAIRRLETAFTYGEVSRALQDETAEALWDIALLIEEGDLSDALERLRRAQERLADAIENGATDEEIAELMQELRDAMQDYMRQLAENSDPEAMQDLAENQDMQQMTGDQLEEMLQQLQELMEQGRTEEAMALLQQLQQMMENMQIARGQQGQGQQSPGQQAMEGLAETLREQQGLSDDAFRDLQEQFGQQQGQPGQEGQPGQPGQGGQQPGQQFGEGQGEGARPGQPGGQQGGEMDLAERQRALREELRRQQEGLPGAGTPEGEAARDALDRAGRAMEGAEEALREEDFAGALDDQSEAIEALREGMRELGEQMAQQQGQQNGQGEAAGEANAMNRRDPLGREVGQNGRLGTDEQLLQGEDVYRRARELLDIIRERSADQTRPDVELDYLRRLLERF